MRTKHPIFSMYRSHSSGLSTTGRINLDLSLVHFSVSINIYMVIFCPESLQVEKEIPFDNQSHTLCWECPQMFRNE